MLVILGAGASVDSGLPTFRGTIENPEDLFTIRSIFDKDKRQKMLDFLEPLAQAEKPGPTYDKLVELVTDGIVVNQNIDGLASKAFAGTDVEVFEIHGNLTTFLCTECDAQLAPCFDADEKCPECGKIIYPDILYYGDVVPRKMQQGIFTYIKRNRPHTVLVLGTSMSIPHIRHLISRAKGRGARVVHVNPSKEYRARHVRKKEKWYKSLDKFILSEK